MKYLLTCLAIVIIYTTTKAQNVGIGTTSPAPSAILEMADTARGLLIPRIDSLHRVGIVSPAIGLMVYETTSNAFWYYNGSVWNKIGSGAIKSLIADADSNTYVHTEKNPNENIIRFTLNGTERWIMKANRLEPKNSNNSVFIGLDAGSSNTGSLNIAIGDSALLNNTIGIENTAVGLKTLISNISGSNNVAFGNGALDSNSTGSINTATGYQALFSNTSGSLNTAVGAHALKSNSSGLSNTANGVNAMYSNNTGNNNAAFGNEALRSNISGSNNTAGGYLGLYLNRIGDNNTALGFDAMVSNKTGSSNTAIGSLSNTGDSALTNTTALGYGTVVDASNKVRIGNASVSSIGGQVGWTTFSDGRFKSNVKENVKGLEFIKRLRPVTYDVDIKNLNDYYNKNRNVVITAPFVSESQSGFIAQEVEQLSASLGFNFSGVDKPTNDQALYGLRYADFVVPLVKAVQEQQTIIENLRKELNMIKLEIATLKKSNQ